MTTMIMSDDGSSSGSGRSRSPSSPRHGSNGSPRPPHSRDDSTSPPPSTSTSRIRIRTSKPELSSYVSFLRDLNRTQTTRPLTARLVDKWAQRLSISARSSPAPTTPGPSGSVGGWDVPLNRTDRKSTASVIDPIVDPAQADTRLDDRWPLDTEALKSSRVDLGEMIRTIAARQIRTNKLSIYRPEPNQAERLKHVETADRVRGTDEVDELEDDDESALPLDIVESTTAFIDQILVGLAVMRPKETRSKRKRMEGIGWTGVIEAAGLIRGNEGVTREANARMKELYDWKSAEVGEQQAETEGQAEVAVEDVIQHRLDVLNRVKEKRKRVQIDDLYASVIPPAPTGKRQHQSAEERRQRDAKRAKRQERRTQSCTAPSSLGKGKNAHGTNDVVDNEF